MNRRNHRRRRRCAYIAPAACIAAVLAVSRSAAAGDLKVSEFNPDAPPLTFGPADIEGDIVLVIADPSAPTVTRVTVLPLPTKLTEVKEAACEAPVVAGRAVLRFDDPKCRPLYVATGAGNWTLSPDDRRTYRRLSFSPGSVVKGKYEWSQRSETDPTLTLAHKGIELASGPNEWVMLDRWRVHDAATTKNVIAALNDGKTLWFSRRVIDGASGPEGRLALIEGVKKELPPTPPPAWDLETACMAAHLTRAPSLRPHYVLCIDYRDPNNPSFIRLVQGKKFSDEDEFHVYENVPLYAYVGHAKASPVELNVYGTVGYGTETYVPNSGESAGSSAPRAEAGAPEVTTTFFFSHPLKGEFATIVVKPRGAQGAKDDSPRVDAPKGAAPPPGGFQTKLAIEPRYRGAIRMGVGFAWSPMQFEYEARTSNSANTGKYIAISDGGDASLASHVAVELMVGGSVFFRPVRDRWTVCDKPTGGWYFGVGLAEASTTGARVFSSFHLGPELVLGKEYSIALTASVRRIDRLKDSYRVGQAVTAEDKFVKQSVGVGISLIINFSPKIFSAVGKIGKIGAGK